MTGHRIDGYNVANLPEGWRYTQEHYKPFY